MSIWDSELVNPSLRKLKPYEPGKPIEDVAREFQLDPDQVIKLASNENPLGPSPAAVEAMRNAASSAHLYPDGGGFHLREAIAARHGVTRQQVVLGNGSNEIIELAYHAFTRPGSTSVVASRYAFVVYRLMAELFGVDMIEVPDRDFAHDLDAMREAIRPDTRLVFIASPNNPTGLRLSNEALHHFLSTLPETVIPILDEAYYEFLADPPPSEDWLQEFPRLIVTRTFSKIQGLAALRIGYGLANTDVAEVLQRCRQPFNANAPAQAAALASFHDLDHQEKTKKLNAAGRDDLQAFCRQHDLPALPSEANFILMKTGHADALFSALQRRGVIIRSMTGYGLPDWIRVSIGTPDQMTAFKSHLLDVLPSL